MGHLSGPENGILAVGVYCNKPEGFRVSGLGFRAHLPKAYMLWPEVPIEGLL